MGSSYKGDSPGKKLSRFRTWIGLQRLGSILYVPYQGALALAGEGGDIATLTGIGVPVETITVVDYDEEWLEFCSEVYPGVKTVHGELGAVSKGIGFSLAHIDFCGGLSEENIKTVADVFANVDSHPSVIAITMLKGRETRGKAKPTLLQGIPRGQRRRTLSHARKMAKTDNPITQSSGRIGEHVLTPGVFDPMWCLERSAEKLLSAWPRKKNRDFNILTGIFTKRGEIGPTGKALIRANAMQECAEWLMDARNIRFGGEPLVVQQAGVFGYHSRSEKAHGTPFLTAFYVVHRQSQHDMVIRLLSQEPGAIKFHTLNIEESMSYLQPTAAAIAKYLPVEAVSKIFDVPPRTIVAWKAHAARGTYEKESLVTVHDMTGENSEAGAHYIPDYSLGSLL
jgi:hypothetical protein